MAYRHKRIPPSWVATRLTSRQHRLESSRPLDQHCHREYRLESPQPLDQHCHREYRLESPRPLDRPRLAAVLVATLLRSLLRRGRIERPAPFIPTRRLDEGAPPCRLFGSAPPCRLFGPAVPRGWTVFHVENGGLPGDSCRPDGPGSCCESQPPPPQPIALLVARPSLLRCSSLARAFLARAPSAPLLERGGKPRRAGTRREPRR